MIEDDILLLEKQAYRSETAFRASGKAFTGEKIYLWVQLSIKCGNWLNPELCLKGLSSVIIRRYAND